MDLNTIKSIKRPTQDAGLSTWRPGCAWLAGGTWLFSEPQWEHDTLIDLETLNWPSLVTSEEGLEIAATCKVVELDAWVAPAEWIAVPLFRECCRSFLASFKIWNEASVGGNIALSLPAGPMISLTAALEGVCTLWPRDSEPRLILVADFVTGDHMNVLAPGEVLRSVFLPASALRKKYAFRRFSLTHLGRSEVLIIGTRSLDESEILITITAATLRPVQLRFSESPSRHDLAEAIDSAIPFVLYLDDPHGSPAHRKHLTHYFCKQITAELQD